MGEPTSDSSLPFLEEHQRVPRLEDLRWPAAYKKAEPLGGGGFGEVFAATERASGKHVAIKMLSDHRYLTRFQREIEYQRKIDHPNVMPILDAGEHWYAMPCAKAALADRAHGMFDAELLGLVQDLCGGLGELHKRGLTHRDVTPANILWLSMNDVLRWVISDLGLLRLPQGQSISPRTRAAVGTGWYRAPEVRALGGHQADHRSDIYSLGRVIEYVLCNGDHPESPVVRPVPAPWWPLVAAMTAENRDERPNSLAHVEEQLYLVEDALRAAVREQRSRVPARRGEELSRQELQAAAALLHIPDGHMYTNKLHEIPHLTHQQLNIGLIALENRKFIERNHDDNFSECIYWTQRGRAWVAANPERIPEFPRESEQNEGPQPHPHREGDDIPF